MADNVAVIVAHPDDEVLGCGGTIIKHTQMGDSVFIIVLADGETSRNNNDQQSTKRNESLRCAASILGVKDFYLLDYPDQRLDTISLLDMVQRIEKILEKLNPTIIYTHHGGDLNLDHKLTFQSVMTACRPLPNSNVTAIYTFETASSTEWASSIEAPFKPVKISDISNQLDAKISALKCYEKEMRDFPHPRSYQAIINSAKTRGAQFGLEAAEVFGIERLIWR